jgi:1,4-dihydroxy-2-naphthoyl-CoA hydrolase
VIDAADAQGVIAGTFPGDLGIEFVEVGTGGARARLAAEKRHLHAGGFVHGGVWVALADTVGAWATIANLPENHDFSTAEMKVNLFGAARDGDVLEATAQPLHLGRRTHVWEVRVKVGDRLRALFVCTQILVAREGGRSSLADRPAS